MIPYFVFKNTDSKDYLIVNKLPSVFKAERNIKKQEVEGRDGFLTIDDGTYKSTVKPVECTIKDLNDIDFICSWLDGGGEVIFSNEPEKIYKATIINQIEFKRVFVNFHSFLIQFDCQPHKNIIGNDTVTLTSAGSIYNNGSAISKPIVKVYGSGAISLIVNSKTFKLLNVNEYITIDSDFQNSFKDTQPLNNLTDGEFPILEMGNNFISWTGAVIKVEITPNFRYL